MYPIDDLENRVVDVHPTCITEEMLLFALPKDSKKGTSFKYAVCASEFVKDPGENYGIRLTDRIDVDWDNLNIDERDVEVVALYQACRTLGTWAQKTGGTNRGEQYMFFSPKYIPKSSCFGIYGEVSGIKYGEILSGEHYIVAPGSVVLADKGLFKGTRARYEMLEGFSSGTVDIPEVILSKVRSLEAYKPKAEEGEEDETPILDRTRMLNFVAALRDLGYSSKKSALAAFKAQSAICQNYDPQDPFKYADLLKMAEDWEVVEGVNVDDGKGRFINATLLDYTTKTYEEFIPGLLIRGQLHSFYGDSGVNKTGVGARMLSIVSQCGYNVAFIGSEDGPEDFVRRYLASGGVFDRLFTFKPEAKHIILHKDHEKGLCEEFEKDKFVCVLFDSIVDHRANPRVNDNAADIARNWAGAAARIALQNNCAIIGISHENAAGTLEGGVQQKAKARIQAHFTKNENGSTTISVTKANRSAAGMKYTAMAEAMRSINPATGKVDQKIVRDAEGNPQTVELTNYICTAVIPDPANFATYTIPYTQADKNHDARVAKLVEWFETWPGKHTVDEIKKKNILGKDFVLKTLTDPQFTLLPEKELNNRTRAYILTAHKDNL